MSAGSFPLLIVGRSLILGSLPEIVSRPNTPIGFTAFPD